MVFWPSSSLVSLSFPFFRLVHRHYHWFHHHPLVKNLPVQIAMCIILLKRVYSSITTEENTLTKSVFHYFETLLRSILIQVPVAPSSSYLLGITSKTIGLSYHHSVSLNQYGAFTMHFISYFCFIKKAYLEDYYQGYQQQQPEYLSKGPQL